VQERSSAAVLLRRVGEVLSRFRAGLGALVLASIALSLGAIVPSVASAGAGLSRFSSLSSAAPLDALTPAGAASDAVDELSTSGVQAAMLERPASALREVVSRRTARSTTWEMPSGARVTRIAAAPVRWRDQHGAWRPFDLDLHRHSGSGAESFETGADPVAVRVPDSLGAGTTGASRVSSARGWVEATLEGAQGDAAVSGSRAVYADAESGVDVQLDATPDGLKETLVLDGPSAARSFVYRLRVSDGLRASLDAESGSVVIADASGPVFVIPRASIEDSAAPIRPGPAPRYTLADGAAHEWTLAVSVDDAWLDDPQRVWPVRVDPTTWAPNATVSCMDNTSTVDQFTTASQYTACAPSVFYAGGFAGTGSGRLQYDGRLKFPSISSSLATGDIIDSATLHLYQTGYGALPGTGFAGQVMVAGIQAPWTTGNVQPTNEPRSLANTANGSQPQYPSGATVVHSVGATNTWVDFNVIGIVNAWQTHRSDPLVGYDQNGFRVLGVANAYDSGRCVTDASQCLTSMSTFAAAGWANAPYLEIVSYAAPSASGPQLEVRTEDGASNLYNVGDAEVTIDDMSIVDDGEGDLYQVGPDLTACYGVTLEPGGDGCVVHLGGTHGVLEVDTSEWPSPALVTIGATPTPTPTPTATPTPTPTETPMPVGPRIVLDGSASWPEGPLHMVNVGDEPIDVVSVESIAGNIHYDHAPGEFQGYGACAGHMLQPDGNDACQVDATGDSGVLRFITTSGDRYYVGITPDDFQASSPPPSGPRIVVDRQGSRSDGYLTIRNFGNKTGKILAVELASGDFAWGGSGDACTGQTLDPGSDSCVLRVTGASGTLRVFLAGDEPQNVAVVLDDLPPAPVYTPTPQPTPTPTPTGTPEPTPTPGPGPAHVVSVTMGLDYHTPDSTYGGVKYWRVGFANDGGTDATITHVETVGSLEIFQGDDICTGRTLAANKSPHGLAQVSCEIGLGNHDGLVRFSLDDGAGHITTQDVALDMDTLTGWLTQPDDTIKPAIWNIFNGFQPANVRLRENIQRDNVEVSDAMGIDRIELRMVSLQTGIDYLLHSEDYTCQISWPPPRTMPIGCQNYRYVSFVWFAGFLCSVYCDQQAAHPYPDGAYRVYWRAKDSRSNWGRYDVPEIAMIDHTPPVVSVSGLLLDSAGKNQMLGDDLFVYGVDATSGTKSVWLDRSIDTGWLRDEHTRTDCPGIPCPTHEFSYPWQHVDPVGNHWPNGTQSLEAGATDAATNASVPYTWNVSFWKTSWVYGNQANSEDRTINATGEINAVRTALTQDSQNGQDGYNNPASTVWNGITPEDRPIIYTKSWALFTGHQISTAADVYGARNDLGATAYANTTALDGYSPTDRPKIYPTSWNYGGSSGAGAHSVDTDAEKQTLGDVFASATQETASALWSGLSPGDQDLMGKQTTYYLDTPTSAATLAPKLAQLGDSLQQIMHAQPAAGGASRGSDESVASFIQAYRSAYVAENGVEALVAAVVISGSASTSVEALLGAHTVTTNTRLVPGHAPPMTEPPDDSGWLLGNSHQWAPDHGELRAAFVSPSARPNQISSTFTFPTGSLHRFNRTLYNDYAYEHDMKLEAPDAPGGKQPACAHEDDYYWARRSGLMWTSNIPWQAAPYLDTNVGDECQEGDMTIGLYYPQNLQENHEYRITMMSKDSHRDVSNHYALVAQKAVRWCAALVADCVETKSGGDSVLLVGDTKGIVPGCRRWYSGRLSTTCP
jgi:hypothetical protein